MYRSNIFRDRPYIYICTEEAFSMQCIGYLCIYTHRRKLHIIQNVDALFAERDSAVSEYVGMFIRVLHHSVMKQRLNNNGDTNSNNEFNEVYVSSDGFR